MKRVMCVLLMIVFCGAFLMSCSMPLKNSKEEKQRIVVQLDQDYWLASVGRMLKEHFPDVEFDFVISRGGAQYLNDAAVNDDLHSARDFENIVLKDGDVVEFLYFMGGGCR